MNNNISIIVPSYNRAKKTLRLLQSLEKQNISGFEVIVVIDGSTDDTLEVLQTNTFYNFNLKIIQQKNSGRSITRNNGVKAASSELILFLDDDMRMESTSVSSHLIHHSKYKETILVGQTLEDNRLLKTDIQHYKKHLSEKWIKQLTRTYCKISTPFITAAHFSMPKKLFISLGMFDEQLTDNEDYDLALKAKKAGVDIYYNPTLMGWHDDFITAASYLRRLKEYAQSRRHLSQINSLIEIPKKEKNLIKRAVYYLFSFDFWIQTIDNESLNWLPQAIRFKLYDFIFHSQSAVYVR